MSRLLSGKTSVRLRSTSRSATLPARGEPPLAVPGSRTTPAQLAAPENQADHVLKLFKGSIARNTIRTTLVFGLRLAAQAGTLICLTRLLGPARFGEFSAIAALAVLLGTLSTLGTHIVLLGETAISPARRAEVLRYAIPATLCLGILLLLAYLGAIAFVFPRGQIPFFVALLIGASELVLQPLNQLASGELQGLGKTPQAQMLLTVPLFTRALILSTLLLIPTPLALEIFAAGYIATTVLTLGLFQRRLPELWPGPSLWRLPTPTEIRDTIGYAVLNLASNGTFELDKAISTRLIGATTAGTYTAGSRIIGAISLPIVAMSIAAMPHIFREADKHSPTRSPLQRRMFLISGIYGICAGLALWLCAPLFVMLFGEKFLPLPRTLAWLAFACPAVSLRLAAGTFFTGTKHPWLRCGIECSGILIFLILAPILSSLYAYTGFLAALLISEWTMALTGWIYLFRKQPIPEKTKA